MAPKASQFISLSHALICAAVGPGLANLTSHHHVALDCRSDVTVKPSLVFQRGYSCEILGDHSSQVLGGYYRVLNNGLPWLHLTTGNSDGEKLLTLLITGPAILDLEKRFKAKDLANCTVRLRAPHNMVFNYIPGRGFAWQTACYDPTHECDQAYENLPHHLLNGEVVVGRNKDQDLVEAVKEAFTKSRKADCMRLVTCNRLDHTMMETLLVSTGFEKIPPSSDYNGLTVVTGPRWLEPRHSAILDSVDYSGAVVVSFPVPPHIPPEEIEGYLYIVKTLANIRGPGTLRAYVLSQLEKVTDMNVEVVDQGDSFCIELSTNALLTAADQYTIIETIMAWMYKLKGMRDVSPDSLLQTLMAYNWAKWHIKGYARGYYLASQLANQKTASRLLYGGTEYTASGLMSFLRGIDLKKAAVATTLYSFDECVQKKEVPSRAPQRAAENDIAVVLPVNFKDHIKPIDRATFDQLYAMAKHKALCYMNDVTLPSSIYIPPEWRHSDSSLACTLGNQKDDSQPELLPSKNESNAEGDIVHVVEDTSMGDHITVRMFFNPPAVHRSVEEMVAARIFTILVPYVYGEVCNLFPAGTVTVGQPTNADMRGLDVEMRSLRPVITLHYNRLLKEKPLLALAIMMRGDKLNYVYHWAYDKAKKLLANYYHELEDKYAAEAASFAIFTGYPYTLAEMRAAVDDMSFPDFLAFTASRNGSVKLLRESTIEAVITVGDDWKKLNLLAFAEALQQFRPPNPEPCTKEHPKDESCDSVSSQPPAAHDNCFAYMLRDITSVNPISRNVAVSTPGTNSHDAILHVQLPYNDLAELAGYEYWLHRLGFHVVLREKGLIHATWQRAFRPSHKSAHIITAMSQILDDAKYDPEVDTQDKLKTVLKSVFIEYVEDPIHRGVVNAEDINEVKSNILKSASASRLKGLLENLKNAHRVLCIPREYDASELPSGWVMTSLSDVTNSVPRFKIIRPLHQHPNFLRRAETVECS